MVKPEKFFLDCDISVAMNAPEKVVADFKSKLNNRKLIIYGAGIIGSTLFCALRSLGMEVSLVVDKNSDEITEIEDIPVSKPQELKNLDDINNYLIIMAAGPKPAKSMLYDLTKLDLDISVVENGAFVTDVLQCTVCALKLKNGDRIDHAACSDCSILDNICPALRKYGIDLIGFKDCERQDKKSKSTTMIGYALGNVCTLNCRHCCESLPLYTKDKRKFVDTRTVIKDVVRLASAAEFLTLIEFVGGEPFLHPGLPEIIQCVLQIPNAAFVRIFTNGTVLPSEDLLNVLSNSRVAVYISNYTGMLSDEQIKRLEQTKQALTKAGVAFIYGGYKKWFDFSSYDFQADNDEELSRRFSACFLHNCNRLHKGVLYACPHHYAGHNLGILDASDDNVRIHELGEVELVEALEAFKKRSFVEACKRCQMPFKAPLILAGES